MGKSKTKRGASDVDEVLQRPWCYYCERDFDDLKILISHQRAKHFKCERCNRRLNTVGGLSVHMNQVHKEQLQAVENSLPNRNDVTIEIFGMEGIPAEIIQAHVTRVTEAYFRSEAQHRALTGNPPPGGKQQSEGGVKRPIAESAEDIKKRLEMHKAKRRAGAAGMGSGDNTPVHASQSPMALVSDANGYTPSAASPPPGFHANQPPPGSSYPGYQGYPHFAPSPVHQPPYPTPGYPHLPFSPNGSMASGPPQMGYGAAMAPSPSQPPYHPPVPGPPMSASGMTPGLPQPAPGLPQRPAFGAPNLSKEEMSKMHSGMPQMPGNNPAAFNGPQAHQPSTSRAEADDGVDEMIKSITGQSSFSSGNNRQLAYSSDPPGFPPDRRARQMSHQPAHAHLGLNELEAHEDPEQVLCDVRGEESRHAEEAAEVRHGNDPSPVQGLVTPPKQAETSVAASSGAAEKKKKKSKHRDEAVRLIYNDSAISPEEKMAQRAKYAFDCSAHESTQTVLGDISGAVTGGAGETIRDPADRGI